MADVKRCDMTGEIADSMNPTGWLRISVQPYGIGQQTVLTGDVANQDAARKWLEVQLQALAADKTIAGPVPTAAATG
jgi:hypothetical protein